jgi:hypothetical protein
MRRAPSDLAEILPQWYNPLRRCAYAFTILYNPALMTTRTTILILYHNIAAAHPFLRYASLCTMALINIAGIVLTFLNIFQCHPISAAFSEVDGTCIDIVSLYFASAPINALTDLAILLLPLPILTTLRVEFREKVIVVATFMIGGFATLVDVVRIFYLQEPLKEERQIDMSRPITPTKRPANFSYYASFSLMWLSVEVSVGIMCCCVLVLKPLVMRVMPKLLGGHHGHPLPTGTPESHRRSAIPERCPDRRGPRVPFVRVVNHSDGFAHLTSNLRLRPDRLTRVHPTPHTVFDTPAAGKRRRGRDDGLFRDARQ